MKERLSSYHFQQAQEVFAKIDSKLLLSVLSAVETYTAGATMNYNQESQLENKRF